MLAAVGFVCVVALAGPAQTAVTAPQGSLGNPTVTTLAPANVTQTSAGLRGTITWSVSPRLPQGFSPCTWYFEYGTTTAYGFSTPSVSVPCGDDVAIATLVTDLSPGTKYNYRLVLNWDGQLYFGSNVVFTTVGVDSDGDGVPDSTDNCDAVANPNQADTDHDGIGDACDTGGPSSDADGDGVADASDNCPDVANPGQEDANQNDVGDACESVEPPEALRTVNVSEVSGNVLVKLKGTNQFVPLGPEVQIPLGSTIDARAGKVRLFAASGGGGAGRPLPVALARASGGDAGVQSAVFGGGIFRVKQDQRIQLVTVLTLTGGNFSRCRSGPGGGLPPRTAVRKVTGEGEGEFQTRGNFGTAMPSTDLTTRWSTVDQCNGTLLKAVKGGLIVRDFVRGKTVHLTAGEHYLIRRKTG